MTKIDYKKTFGALYKPPASKIVEVDVPPMQYLMADGRGSPGSPGYTATLEALFPVAYTLKFMAKKLGVDYAVMPLEGLWWAEDMSAFVSRNKDAWQWTLLLMQPDVISGDMVEDAVAQVRKKKNPQALSDVRFERYAEGKAAQTLYVGSFADEGPTVQAIHDFIDERDYRLAGKHHEIYLSDFRKTAPEKLRTVIRQPYTMT